MFKKYILFSMLAGLSAADSYAQWVQTGGPLGGMVHDFAQNGSTVFAGTHSNGVYVSVDGGSHWTPAGNGFPAYEAGLCFAVKGQQVFAGTRSGVYVTSDNGALWTSVSNGIEDRTVQKLLIKGDTLFAGTAKGVLRSADNGSSWQEINTGLPTTLQLPDVTALAAIGNKLFAGTLNGVFCTENNGNSWYAVSTGLPAGQVNELFYTGTVLLSAGSGNKIFLSANEGATWVPASGFSTGYIESFSKAGGKLFACSNIGPYVSVNDGYTWAPLAAEIPGRWVQTIFETGTTLLAGVWFSAVCASPDSGNSWVESNEGIKLSTIRRLAANGNRLFAVSPNEVYTSTDNGTGWNRVMQGDWDEWFNGFAFTATHTFMASDSGVYVSTDNGANWVLSQPGPFYSPTVHALAIMGNTVFAGTYDGVFRITDNGTHWQEVNLGMNNTFVQCIEVLGNTVFAGTVLDGLYASSDNGNTWSHLVPGGDSFQVSDLQAHGNSLIMANTDGVFRSTDNGLSWTDISPVHGLSFENLAVSGHVLFAGGPQGDILFASTDNGLTWTNIRGNLPPETSLHSLTVAGTSLFAGIADFSVWRMELGNMDVAEAAEAFTVQVGPNPFTDLVHIRLPENQGAVSLRVTDMSGKTVAVAQGTGTELVWSRAGIAAGAYLFHIGNAKGEQVMRRVTVY